MGFKSVYRCLQEIFPEIDARILRAVAIEHSKDADAAVNDVLTEVLPYMADQSRDGSSSASNERNDTLLPHSPVAEAATAEPSSKPGLFTVGESSKDGASRNSNFCASPNLDEVDNTEFSSEPNCAAVGKIVTIYSTGPVTISDHPVLDGVDNTEPSSEPDCTDVGNEVTIDSTVPTLFSDLPDLEVMVSSGISSISSSACKFAEFVLADGSSHSDAATTGSDEPAKESQLLSFSDEGDSHLSTKNMDEELIVLKGKCEWQDDMESSQNVNAQSNALKKKGNEYQAHINTESEVLVSCDKIDDIIGHEQTPSGVSPSMIDEKDDFTGGLSEPDPDCYIANESVVSDEQSFKLDENTNGTLFEPSDIVTELVPQSVFVETEGATKCDLQSVLCSDTPAAGAFNLSSANDYSFIEMDSNEDAFAMNSKLSGQICSTDFLDEIIEEAKNNKKNLFSIMESVMSMIKEVELQERAAEVAKGEAAVGGIDILVKVEEMKQMLAHAKEANDMHAGEVYGEKSILATEVRELQSRLLCLSDERDNSLATLDEMRQTLEARLAAAEEAKTAAEQEKLVKEESALKALAEQEAIMEKVVQESKLLEQEAAENSKLQEFLVDRGRIVDILQGEISVICQDVRLLKEKFDKRVPLSMSVSSSQTTCKLASSASSLKSMASVLAPEEPESSSKSPEDVSSQVSSIDDVAPILSTEEDLVKSDDKEIEDEWDIFDKEEELDR